MQYIYAVVFIVLGAFMLAKPHTVWKIEHFFSVKNGEPSDFYILCTRIIGGILLLGSILVLLAPLLTKLYF